MIIRGLGTENASRETLADREDEKGVLPFFDSQAESVLDRARDMGDIGDIL